MAYDGLLFAGAGMYGQMICLQKNSIAAVPTAGATHR